MIKNFIFDMGNVLISFNPDLYISRLGLNEEDSKLLMEKIYKSKEWEYMDYGKKDEAEVCQAVRQVLPGRLHQYIEELVIGWSDPQIFIEGMYEVVEELKEKGYGIYLLSNASVRQHEYWPDIPASKFFDGKLVSADVGMVKPNKDIYLHLFDKFDLKAEECFFIYDKEDNIIAGRELGMDGFVFENNVDELREKIMSL